MDNVNRYESCDSLRPGIIHEVSEPVSPGSIGSTLKSPPTSALSELIRISPPTEEEREDDEVEMLSDEGVHAVTVGKGIICQPSERTRLLLHKAVSSRRGSRVYDSLSDLERQKPSGKVMIRRIRAIAIHTRAHSGFVLSQIFNPTAWDWPSVWNHGIRQPISYIPPVILGLLLNILDALSYGEIRLLQVFEDVC